MSKIEVRKMISADVEQISFIEKENFSIPWSKQAFYDALQQIDTLFLVITFQEEIIGYVGAYLSTPEGEIMNIAIKEAWKGQGFGSKLLEEFLNEAKTIKIETIYLEVRKSNNRAIGLYEKEGFQPVGIRKNFYQKPLEDAIVMKLDQ